MEANATLAHSDWMAKWGLKSSWAPFAISFVLLSLLIASQIVAGNVAYEVYSQDIFVVLDGILHLQEGHRIHEDFSSTVGIFYLLPYYLTTFLVPLSGMTIIYGNALMGLFAFCAAVIASRDRLPPIWGAALSFYVGLLDISPRLLSLNVSILNYLNQAFYNRFSWGFICILCLLAAPLPKGRESARREAILYGVLLFVLFYLKITYFAVGVGLLFVALAADVRENSRQLAIALATFVAALVVMELLTGMTVPYLRDLDHAILVAHPDRLQDVLDISFHNYNSSLLVLMIAGTSAILGGSSRGSLPKLIYVIAALGAGVLLAAYNHKAYEIPLVPVLALIAMRLFFPWKGTTNELSWWTSLLTIVVALTFARPIVLDLGAMLRAEHRSFVAGSKRDWLQTTPLANLVVTEKPNGLEGKTSAERPECCVENDTEYFYWLSDGTKLLKQHVRSGDRVLTFAWDNPFPVLLDLPTVKHNLLWWDKFRTFSSSDSPKPSELLAEADYVMIPKTDMPWGPAPLMKEIYGPELRAKFRQIDESPFWVLFAKS